MRLTLLPCLGVALAAAVTTSCADQQVTSPRTPSLKAAFNFTGPECDVLVELSCGTGRMTGGGNNITAGDVKVTKGFTLHCDITLSNNLEINWPGHQWHLDKPISHAVCIDQDNINPFPPPAPFDTFLGDATGSLDGVDGSYAQFALVDAGEPGGGHDQLLLRIWTPGGALILDVPLQYTTGGNIQAHYDQPHGQHP